MNSEIIICFLTKPKIAFVFNLISRKKTFVRDYKSALKIHAKVTIDFAKNGRFF